MFYNYFNIINAEDTIIIRFNERIPFNYIHIYIDNVCIKTVRADTSEIRLNKFKLPCGTHLFTIVGEFHPFHVPRQIHEQFKIDVEKNKDLQKKMNRNVEQTDVSDGESTSYTGQEETNHSTEQWEWGEATPSLREVDYRPGDILVASDNAFGIPQGYIGHASLVVDETSILESVNVTESIQVNDLASFFDSHEWYAHYRPKNEQMGRDVVEWGLSYYEKYQQNLEEGDNRPRFSFRPTKNMKELWDTIYCSKLVWLCYYYGADYEFNKRGLWFSPQNLNDELEADDNFMLVEKHPDHTFKINL